MEIAALASFAALVIAWIATPIRGNGNGNGSHFHSNGSGPM